MAKAATFFGAPDYGVSVSPRADRFWVEIAWQERQKRETVSCDHHQGHPELEAANSCADAWRGRIRHALERADARPTPEGR